LKILLLYYAFYALLCSQKSFVCYGNSRHPCYKIAYFQDLSRRVGFQEARQACEIDGGALLSLQSEAEQKLIENMLQNLTKSGSLISDGDFWIGLWRSGEGQTTSSACPDLYKWTDGSISLFRNWYTDEPSCGSLIPNLIYVVIPTIPLLLLILVAFGTCCFQMLHKSKIRTKTSPDQSTLWISKNPRKDSSMEV
uniref:Chondrolectin n=1 Tax=Sphenodon punctatus TaxID=8508 RepID=A0A8D0H319_SPHPU